MVNSPQQDPQGMHEGGDPASAEAQDAAAGVDRNQPAPTSEPMSFAQLGLDAPGAPGMGAAEALPPDRAEDLNEIAADDVGATHMAERASELARGKEQPS